MRIWPLLGWLSKGLHPRVAATWAVGWGKGGCGVGVATGESHGQRSLVGYGPEGHKELDTTEAT